MEFNNFCGFILAQSAWKPPPEPNWIVVLLLGAVVGAFLGYLEKLILLVRFVYNYYFKKTCLEGEWFGYHITKLNYEVTIISSKVVISKGISHTYKVRYEQQVTGLQYEGHGFVKNDHLLVFLEGIGHSESMSFIVENILASKSYTSGLWLSYDHDKKIASSGILLSKFVMTESRALAILNQNITQEKDVPLIHVEKRFKKIRKAATNE